MTRKLGQHSRSVDASKDPTVAAAIHAGRGNDLLELLAPGELVLTTDEAKKQAEAISAMERTGFNGSLETSDDVYRRRLSAFLTVQGEEDWNLSDREAEAIGLYLFGDRVPVVAALLEVGDFEGVLFELLAEHLPWNRLTGWMRPTRTGSIPSKGDVQRYVRSAAKKLDSTSTGLRETVFRAIVDKRNRAVLIRAASIADLLPLERLVFQFNRAASLSTVDLAKTLNRSAGRRVAPAELEEFHADPFVVLARYVPRPILELALAKLPRMPQSLVEALDDDLNGWSGRGEEQALEDPAALRGSSAPLEPMVEVIDKTLEESLARHLRA